MGFVAAKYDNVSKMCLAAQINVCRHFAFAPNDTDSCGKIVKFLFHSSHTNRRSQSVVSKAIKLHTNFIHALAITATFYMTVDK